MRYYRIGERSERLVVRDGEAAYDLTSVEPELTSFEALVRAAEVADRTVDEIARELIEDAERIEADVLRTGVRRPVIPEEVWAAGVTYEISQQAREEESGMGEIYLDVYESERPEVFFKATASRTVGPGEEVGVRADSDWNVPEPELGLVLYEGRIVGYTIGNDVSSRTIEGANPLYLPQAKIYRRSCAIGPCVVTVDAIDDPHDLTMSMTIRDGERVVFEDSTSTGEMVRTCDELISAYTAHNEVPLLAVLLTGTSLVPDEGFTLVEGHEVRITIEGIGTLTNSVTTV